MTKKLNSIDLFAGCGGLSQGFENAGFQPLYVNELNHDAMESYLINRDFEHKYLREKYHSYDIKKNIYQESFFDDLRSGLKKDFRIKDNSIDIVMGGPPCQGFSGIGIRRSYSVEKKQLPSNHLFQDMAYFVHKLNPKVFLFENVAGLINSKWTKDGSKGEIFEDILKTFSDIPKYQVKFKLLHAKDYGVPQNRPRVIIIGYRNDIFYSENSTHDAVEAGFLPAPTTKAPDLIDVLGDLIDENFEYGGETLKYPQAARSQFQKMIRTNLDGKIFKKGDHLTDHQYSKHSDLVRKKFQSMIDNNGKILDEFKTKKFAQRLLPKIWTEKGPTITATSLPDDFVHFSQARTLTVREWARLQTFPDWYQFSGKRTTGGIRRAGNPRKNIFDREVPKYTQIGNAVPVKLAEALALHIKKILQHK